MLAVRGQVQIRKQGLTRPQHLAFRQLRFFDFDHELRRREDLGRRGGNARTGSAIVRVIEADAAACAGFDNDHMAGTHQLGHPSGHQADTVFMDLDLFGHADFHGFAPGGKECA